jgi:hypothetical protein
MMKRKYLPDSRIEEIHQNLDKLRKKKQSKTEDLEMESWVFLDRFWIKINFLRKREEKAIQDSE